MNNIENAYSLLTKYVKRIKYTTTFSANDVREKLVNAGYDKSYLPVVITKAVKSNLIEKVSVTPSTEPSAKGRQVGVYARAEASY